MGRTDPESDDRLMRHAIAVAMRGRGRVEPNPMVGCVIAKAGRIVGQGSHAAYGGPHAEPLAIASCTDSPQGATAYVTLEPCCHTDKQTPPCVPALITAGVGRVVIGCLDPNPRVNGQAVRLLQSAGIDVSVGTCGEQATQLIATYRLGVLHHRPHVTLKWAESADGFVAGSGGITAAITSRESNRVVHQLRARCDAILVGSGTILTDNPLLTARDAGDSRLRWRVILDRRLRTPPDARILADPHGPEVLLLTSAANAATERARRITERSGRVLGMLEPDTDPIEALATAPLSELSGGHVLVEPGPTLATAMLPRADRLWVFTSPDPLNDGVRPPRLPEHYLRSGSVNVGPDRLSEYLNIRADTYAANEPSADLILAAESAGSSIRQR